MTAFRECLVLRNTVYGAGGSACQHARPPTVWFPTAAAGAAEDGAALEDAAGTLRDLAQAPGDERGVTFEREICRYDGRPAVTVKEGYLGSGPSVCRLRRTDPGSDPSRPQRTLSW